MMTPEAGDRPPSNTTADAGPDTFEALANHTWAELRQPALWISWGIGALGIAWLLFTSRFIPLLDWPQHLLTLSIFVHPLDPAWGFADWYTVEPQVTTYIGAWFPAVVLAKVMSVEFALRIVMAVGLAATPVGFGVLLAAFGRSPWWSHLLWALVFSYAYTLGFVPFVTAIPLFFLSLGLAFRSGLRPSRKLTIALGVCTTALFFVHSFAWMMAMPIAAAFGIAASRLRWRSLLWGAVAFVPSTLVWAAWFITHYELPIEETLGASSAVFYGVDSLGSGFYGGSGGSVGERIRQFWPSLHDFFVDDRDLRVMRVWAGVTLVSLAAGLVGAALAATRTPWRTRLAVAGTSLLGLIMFLPAALLPLDLAGVHAVGPRFTLMALASLILCFAGRLPDRTWVRALIFAPALGCGLWLDVVHRQSYNEVADEAQGLMDVLDAPGRGGATYGLIFNPSSRIVARPVFLHAAGHFMSQRGGAVGFTFFNNLSFPIRVTVPGALPWPGRRGEWEPQRFRDDLYGRFYDRLVVRGAAGDINRRIQAEPGTWVLEERSGDWSLWRRTVVDTRGARFNVMDRIHRARVYVEGPQGAACAPWDRARFQCPQNEWVWMGPSQHRIEGQELPCVWAHPVAGNDLVLWFDGIPADARSLWGFTALADSAFQGGEPAADPVQLRVILDGVEVGALDHETRRGLQFFEFALPPATGAAGETRTVEFRVRAEDDGRRHFCFDAWFLGDPDTRPVVR
jgi:hypothetical protein